MNGDDVSIREMFLRVAELAVDAIGDPRVAAQWTQPSVLVDMTVGAVAAHLGRAVLTVDNYLDGATPTGVGADEPDTAVTPVGPVDYVRTALGDAGHDDEVHVGVRARSDAGAAAGPDAVVAEVGDALARLRVELPAAWPDRTVTVLGGMVMRLDDYLVTRVVELVVHLDDLAASTGLDVTPPEDAGRVAVEMLTELARQRHGTTALVRTLARRERAPDGGTPAL